MCPCQKYIQAQRRRQNAEDCVVPAASNKRAGGKEVCGGFRCIWSVTETLTLPVGDPEDIEKSDDGDDVQRRGANKRRSNSSRQRNGLIRGDAS